MSVQKMRERLKTASNKEGYKKQEFFEGVKGIKVDLIDYPENPYKAIHEMVLSTWGHKISKWNDADPVDRFFVVLQALLGNTLQQSLEAPKFTFAISGLSRAAFDQVARERKGVAFAAMGVRDNSHYNFPFRIPQYLAEADEDLVKEIKTMVASINKLYKHIVDDYKASWQAARCILPMNMCYRFTMTIHYRALKKFCSQRMAFCEQEDTVATAWLMRKALEKKFPLLASFLLPACDYKAECLYSRNYKMSQLFGELFKSCGRHVARSDNTAGEFNHACSSQRDIESQISSSIPDDGLELEKFRDLNTRIITAIHNEVFEEITPAIETFIEDNLTVEERDFFYKKEG